MKTINILLSFILSLVLVLGLFVYELSLFTHSKLYNSNMYTTKFEDLNLYSNIESSINKELSTFSSRCNLPKEIFKNVISKDWIKLQMENSTKNLVDYMTYKTNKLYSIDSKAPEAIISANVNSFIKNSNLKIDKAAENELNKVKKDGVNIISYSISPISLKGISNSAGFEKTRMGLNYLYAYKNYLLLFLLIISAALLLLHIKNIYGFIKWASFSLIAGGLIILIPAALAYSSNFANNLAIAIPILKTLISSILKSYITFFLQSGAVVTFAGLLLLITTLKLESLSKAKRG